MALRDLPLLVFMIRGGDILRRDDCRARMIASWVGESEKFLKFPEGFHMMRFLS